MFLMNIRNYLIFTISLMHCLSDGKYYKHILICLPSLIKIIILDRNHETENKIYPRPNIQILLYVPH